MRYWAKTDTEGYDTLTEQDLRDAVWNLENYAQLWFAMADRRRKEPGALHSYDGDQFDWVMGLAAKLEHQADLRAQEGA